MMCQWYCDEDRTVARYVCVTTPRFEPCEERELFEDMGYEYKGGSECFSESIYRFEYRYHEGMTIVHAKSREEAHELYLMSKTA